MLHLRIHGPALSSSDASQRLLLAGLGLPFEAAYAALSELPGMFCEPDGWFAWDSALGEPRWQIAGQLHDRGPELDHVEVKITGSPPEDRLSGFLAALGWPAARLTFVLVRSATVVDEPSWRRLVADQG
jgi:hypothetical protein